MAAEGSGAARDGGFSGLSPGPPGSLGAQLPGSWLGLMFPKRPPELGSCLLWVMVSVTGQLGW